MKLTSRLAVVASKVPIGSIVADIGTDHAYVPIFLIENKICQKVIALDINKGPLERAKIQINKNHFQDFIEARLGSGLNTIISGEADTVIIAGMGGMLIRDIMSEGEDVLRKVDTIILQPMIAQEVLREWIYNNGYKIVDETLAKEEDKIYTIMVVKHGKELVDKIYYEIGKKLIENKDPLLNEYLNKKIREIEKVIEKIEGKKSSKAEDSKKEYQAKLEKYMEIYKSLGYNI